MTRLNKILSLTLVIVFILACNTVTQPISDAQNLAGTAQSFASALPMETLQALASEIPVETLRALPSAAPTFEAIASSLPDFGNMFNPQGTPLSEWNGIPIMAQATAGQEFPDTKTYSFKVDAKVKEANDFYEQELPKLGWDTSGFNMPGNDTMAVLVYQKGNDILTVTITDTNGSVVVMLTMA
jgi:hypothetical protein